MSVPSWEDFNVWVLRVLNEGETLSIRELRREVPVRMKLTEEQLSATVSSGQSMVANRIGWAASYLTRVDALERPQRAHYRITGIGRQLLVEHPDRVTEHHLRMLAKPDDKWWITVPKHEDGAQKSDEVEQVDTKLDPIAQVEQGITRIHEDIGYQLLSRLQEREWGFFEEAVVDLLLKMGYGGVHGRGQVTRFTRDGGIDGVIDQDALGLNKVYIQAKRYGANTAVQRPEVQSFAGALRGKADGGVFITTGRFTSGALEYVNNSPDRIILVDGQQLVSLMIQYRVGVEVKQTYSVVEIDDDYFT
ncbi:restriction endonuclease [Enteractinococcus fodinae]